MSKELTELGQWKVGQKVLVKGFGTFTSESISTINRITDGRDGTIYVGQNTYRTDGLQRGDTTWGGNSIRIATEADIIRVKCKIVKRRLKGIEWENLDCAKAIEIEKLLNDNGIITIE